MTYACSCYISNTTVVLCLEPCGHTERTRISTATISLQSVAEDEAEDGALEEADYAVGEEEVMQDANMEAQQEDASQRDSSANGIVQRQPDIAEEDRYVATAYSEGEDQDERCPLHLSSQQWCTLHCFSFVLHICCHVHQHHQPQRLRSE